MITRDPTVGYYERPGIANTDEVEIIVREILRFIRQTNPAVMARWTMDDTHDAIQMAKDAEYTAPMLSMAYTRLKARAQMQDVSFGDFYKIVSDVKKHWESYSSPAMTESTLAWQEKEMLLNARHQERIKNAPPAGSKDIAKYWLAIIKSDLKKGGGITKKLPYSKSWRVNDRS